MTNGDIVRLRRQMQLRIRAVVAERRLARPAAPAGADDGDQGPDTVKSRTTPQING